MLDERRKVDKTRRWRLRQGGGEREKRARGDVRQEVEARRCCCSIARSLGLVSWFLAAYGQLECCLLPLLLLFLLLHSHNFAIASRVHGRDSLYLLPLAPSSIFLRAIPRADATYALSLSLRSKVSQILIAFFRNSLSQISTNIRMKSRHPA